MLTKEFNTTQDLLEGVLNFGPEILNSAPCGKDNLDILEYARILEEKYLHYPIPPTEINASEWFIPKDYCPNLTETLYSMCKTEEQTARVRQELELYSKHKMYDVLCVMKYVVDTLRQNNIVWGVGRGSSVASYVLYLIGVHKIDSIKYKLPIEEFFKEI
jgi:DNA polymerase III alpha subunit